MNIGIFVLN